MITILYDVKLGLPMKIILLLLILSTMPIQLINAAEHEGKHVFILSGQSNMTALDPNVTFIPTLKTELGDQLIVVKDAMRGQPISRWIKNPITKSIDNTPFRAGDLYYRLIQRVKEAVFGKKISSVTLIWMQGESDANSNKQAEEYALNLRILINQFNEDLNLEHIYFVIGRISDCCMQQPEWQKIRSAQVNVAEESMFGSWVNTDDLNEGKTRGGQIVKNNLHYSIIGYEVLGKRFADKAIELIKRNE